MGAFSFGSYFPGSGVLYRLDPRTKLLAGLALLATALASRTFWALAPLAFFTAGLYALSGVPAGRALRSLAPLAAIVAVVAVLNLLTNHSGRVLASLWIFQITEGSVRACLFMGARMLIMMCGMSLVTLTTTTLDLTCALERLLAPFARLGLPAHELGMMLGIALRFMPQLAGELAQTWRAQVSRGARASGGPLGAMRMFASVATPLITGVFRHAETLSEAMDARLYHGEQGRTRLHPLRFAARDAGAAVCMAALAACVVAVGVLTA